MHNIENVDIFSFQSEEKNVESWMSFMSNLEKLDDVEPDISVYISNIRNEWPTCDRRFPDIPISLMVLKSNTWPHFKHSRFLDLSMGKFCDEHVESIKSLFFLSELITHLDLSWNAINPSSIVEILSFSESLTFLNLGNNELGDEGFAKVFSESSKFAFEYLNLTSNRLTANAIRTMKRNVSLKEIHFLIMDNNSIGNEGMLHLLEMDLCELKSLSLKDNGIDSSTASALFTSRKSDKLESLEIASNEIGCDGLWSLSKKNNSTLKKLDISSNKLGDESLKAFCKSKVFERLERLSMSNNNIKGTSLLGTSRRKVTPFLKELDVSFNEIDENTIGIVLDVFAGSNLKKLDASYNQIGDVGLETLSSLASSISSLSLRANKVTPAGINHLCSKMNFERLECLDISDNELSGQHLCCDFGGFSQVLLRKLYLDNVRFCDDDIIRLLKGECKSHLEMLSLEMNEISDKCIFMFEDMSFLKDLRLSYNLIGNEGMRRLSLLKVLKNVRTLGLSSCGITDPGVVSFSKNGNFDRLYFLMLDGNSITSKGVNALLDYNVLRTTTFLNFEDNKIDYRGAIRLLTSDLPNLRYLDIRNNDLQNGDYEEISILANKKGIYMEM